MINLPSSSSFLLPSHPPQFFFSFLFFPFFPSLSSLLPQKRDSTLQNFTIFMGGPVHTFLFFWFFFCFFFVFFLLWRRLGGGVLLFFCFFCSFCLSLESSFFQKEDAPKVFCSFFVVVGGGVGVGFLWLCSVC